jgi:hypothetical protein
MDDIKKYHDWQDRSLREREDSCRRCGACCGLVEGDPCEQLGLDSQGLAFCHIYENRFGVRHSRSGRKFLCVPIRDILHQYWPGCVCCAYKKQNFTGK